MYSFIHIFVSWFNPFYTPQTSELEGASGGFTPKARNERMHETIRLEQQQSSGLPMKVKAVPVNKMKLSEFMDHDVATVELKESKGLPMKTKAVPVNQEVL